MKVLITGGTGFIGANLADACLHEGDQVRILGQANTATETRNCADLQAAGADVIMGSITDREAVFSAVADVEIVYHLAAAQHEADRPDSYFWDVNVTGSRHVLDACAEAGVHRIVHASTIGVYGAAVAPVLNERSPTQAENIYAETKLAAEQLVREYAHRVPATIIRVSETYGPRDFRLLKLFRGIEKGTFFLIGNGSNRHHPIYVDDLVDGLRLAASRAEAVGETLILAGREVITSAEMCQAIADQLQTKPPSLRLPMPPFLLLATVMETICTPLGISPPLHHRRLDFFRKSYSFSTARAEEILGFRPGHTFAQGVRNTLAWYQANHYL